MQWIQIDGVRINVDKIVSYKKVDNKTVIKMVDFDKIESEALDAVISSFAILNDFDASETEENEEDDNNFKDDILE